MADYINKKELLDEAYECKSNIQYTSPYQNEIDTMVSGMERIIDIIEDAFTEDVVPVVRCKDCKHSREFDKHCEINRNSYRHCALWRGEETINVWHKYTKHWNDYSIVGPDDYCSYGERKNDNE